MRADEVVAGERIRHPHTGDIVTVAGRTDKLNQTIIRFKAKGQHGRFAVTPQHELEECT